MKHRGVFLQEPACGLACHAAPVIQGPLA